MEKEEINKIEIRSEDVQEILGNPPRWIVRWGVSILFILLVVLLVGSYFYKYPEILQSQITITTINPPAPLQALSSGKIIQINADEKQIIPKGFVVAIVDNTANIEDIQYLHTILDTLTTTLYLSDTLDLNLGELQQTYSSFMRLLKDFKNFKSLNYYAEKINAVAQQKQDYQLYYNRLRTQRNIQENQYKISTIQFEREKSLYEKSVISKSDYEKAEKTYLQEKLGFENARTTLANTQIQINQLDQQILDLKLQKTQDEESKQIALSEALQNLKSQLKKWEQTYLIISPIEGKVTFTQVWSVNQNVQTGEVVATVIPTEETKIIGKIMIPANGVGKVKVGQDVNIKVNNFPYMEFGLLKAKIKNISLVPVVTKEGAIYIAEVDFPQNLVTNYDKKLTFSQEMTGSAEIITEDIRMIERLIQPLKYILKKQ